MPSDEPNPSDDPNPIDDETLDDLVAALRAIAEETRMEQTLDIGGVTIDRMFSGSAELFERTWRRNKAWRATVETWRTSALTFGDLLTRTRLKRMVRVAAQYRRFPSDLQQGLSWHHHAALLRLPDLADRMALGREAMAQGWSPAEIKQRIPRDEEKARLRRRLRRLMTRLTRLRALLDIEDPKDEETRIRQLWIPIHMRVIMGSLDKIQARFQSTNSDSGDPEP